MPRNAFVRPTLLIGEAAERIAELAFVGGPPLLPRGLGGAIILATTSTKRLVARLATNGEKGTSGVIVTTLLAILLGKEELTIS